MLPLTTRNPDTFGGQKPPKISDYRRKQVIFGGIWMPEMDSRKLAQFSAAPPKVDNFRRLQVNRRKLSSPL